MKKAAIVLVAMIVLSGCTKKAKTKVEEFSGSLKEAMKLKAAMKCEWEQNGNKGTSFIKGKNLYVANVIGGKKSFVIQKDGCMWSWQEGAGDGVKICLKDQEIETGGENSEVEAGEFKAEGVNWQAKYKCAPAMFGQEKFNPPSTVKFMDMDAMMQKIPGLKR